MSGILVLAETRLGELRDVSLELIGAAREIADAVGGPVKVAVLDGRPERYVPALSVRGVEEVLLVQTPTEHFEAHVTARALETLIDSEQPGLVLLGHTVDSLGVGPAVAARGRLGFASDVTALAWDGCLSASRGAYGDKLRDDLVFPEKPCVVLMLRAGSFEAASGSATPVVRTVAATLADAVATEHAGFREVEAADVDVTKAEFLLSVGRGVKEKENLARFESLAERLGAVLTVSRPLVDAGWASGARQVGQSGKTVKPRVYLAFGISGAIQHLAGMRSAETVIAVNTDPEAPIFGVAHYGAVADMFEIADELERVLGSAG
jgi:electron transfer flavoprotein alpha subunit